MDILQKYNFSFPTAIRFGVGVISELPDYLKQNQLNRPLLVTDPIVKELDFLKNSRAIEPIRIVCRGFF